MVFLPSSHVISHMQVEILGRCCRVWVDEETVSDEAVRMGEVIMKAGGSFIWHCSLS